ncbi:hypothetical protein [Pontibacillus sp. HMF3514]|uniref:hypothetical protein n=1 Tax=Pontibacillus sp. HMF3514 TaxID=2692425 RepID=UPI00131F8EFF|nr:hypothetical protein [Pontibacillus sp. HMF3514]QHE51685.1 hypothetical protein GS400_06380 [Pontibacillus sp. HMF3514]
MRIISFIKQLSLTNVGRSGMNDRYFLFPQKDDDVIKAFFTRGHSEEFEVIDKETLEVYKLKVTFPKNGECRITKFGDYVRNKNLYAGDELILEKRSEGMGGIEYFIDYIRYETRIILRYNRNTKAYYTWNQERFHSFFPDLPQNVRVKDKDNFINIEISFKDSIMLRANAKEKTPVYHLEG